MTPVRIIITASRDWGMEFLGHLHDALVEHAGLGPHEFVLGDARGGDDWALGYAEERGWEVDRHEADWRPGGVYRPWAGNLRNQAMVDSGGDLCLGFPLPGSKGTFDCMKRAERAGIKTVQVTRG